MRKLAWTFFSIALLVTIFTLLAYAALKSEFTSQWMVQQIGSRLLPGKLTLNNIQGDLLSEIIIDDVEYDVGPQQMKIDNVSLRFSPLALFTGKLQINSLDIKMMACTVTEDLNAFREFISNGLIETNIPLTIAANRVSVSELIVEVSNRRFQAHDLNLKGRLINNRLFVEAFETQFSRFRIGFSGEVNLAAPVSYQGRLRWRSALTKAFDNVGACTISGDVDQMTLNIEVREPFSVRTTGILKWGQDAFTLSGVKPPASKASSTNSGSAHSTAPSSNPVLVLQIENLQAKTLHGEVALDGQVIWQDEPAWDIILSANNINPGSRFPEWPGELTIKASVQGRLTDGIPQLSIPDFILDGRLLDQPINAKGHIATAGDRLSAADIQVISGVNTMLIKSGDSDVSDIEFDFVVADPYSLWPPFKGTFSGNGTVSDLYENPQVALQIDGKQIKYTAATIKNIHVDAEITLNDSMTSNANIKMNQLQLVDKRYPSLSVSTSGDRYHQQVVGSIQSTKSQLDFNFSGLAKTNTWEFIAETVSLSSTEDEQWHLLESARIRLDRKKMEPFIACWKKGKTSRCIDGDWRFDTGLKITGDPDVPPFQFISDFTKKLIESRDKKSPEV